MFIFSKPDYKLFKDCVEQNILSLSVIGLAKCIVCPNKVFSKVHCMYLVIKSSVIPSALLKSEEDSGSKYATLPRKKCLLLLLFIPKLAWLKDQLLSSILGKRSDWLAFFSKAVHPSLWQKRTVVFLLTRTVNLNWNQCWHWLLIISGSWDQVWLIFILQL